jgi:hypothetical protein
MLRKSLRTSAGEPSFFYLMLADSCFQRAVETRHLTGSGTLREIGRSYLASARGVASVLESQTSELRSGATPLLAEQWGRPNLTSGAWRPPRGRLPAR